MGWSLPLRAWQREAVLDWGRRRPDNYLAIVTPGGGKTRFACAVSYGALDGGLVQQIIVVVPTTPLCQQWSVDAAGVGIQLDPAYSTGAHLARDLHGVVVTYAQVIQDPRAFARLCGRRRSLVVFDEIHHAGEESVWGQAMLEAFSNAVHRLHLSGTPFRSDESKIVFLEYDEQGYVVADYAYGYREALRDKIVRPVVAYPQGAEVTWRTADGMIRKATFEEHGLTKRHAAERLRAVLEHEGWIADVLVRAHSSLTGVRKSDPDAAALAVTMNATHARFVATIMRNVLGIEPTIVLSEDTESDQRLARFRHSRDPWLIAVRKVSEGVDIPRLRVESYLTNARTELLFRQIVGRIVRVREQIPVPAYLFVPSDPQLLGLVKMLEADVKGKYDIDAPVGVPADSDGGGIERDSAFEVLDAAHVEAEAIIPEIRTVDPFVVPEPPPAAVKEAVPLAYERQRLRTAVAAVTGKVATQFNLTRKDVYGYWVAHTKRNIEQATTEELQRRLSAMQSWLKDDRCPIRARTRAG